jgi:hypothetical protein
VGWLYIIIIIIIIMLEFDGNEGNDDHVSFAMLYAKQNW